MIFDGRQKDSKKPFQSFLSVVCFSADGKLCWVYRSYVFAPNKPKKNPPILDSVLLHDIFSEKLENGGEFSQLELCFFMTLSKGSNPQTLNEAGLFTYT